MDGGSNNFFSRAKWAAYGKDVVVVHSIERSKFTPNISPFPMKLETWLRMAEIPYKVNFLSFCNLFILLGFAIFFY